MNTAGMKANRPLSPHLQIYHMYMTMAMSIIHRITGGALYFGTLLLVWWLVAAASGPEYFNFANSVLGSWPGLVVLFGFTWALLHHAIGGVRHLVMDLGYGFGRPARDILATLSLIASAALTILIWLIGLAVW